MEIEIKVNEKVKIEISPFEIVDEINSMSIESRWNIVRQIIDPLNLSSDDLSPERKQIVKTFLEKHLKMIQENKTVFQVGMRVTDTTRPNYGVGIIEDANQSEKYLLVRFDKCARTYSFDESNLIEFKG